MDRHYRVTFRTMFILLLIEEIVRNYSVYLVKDHIFTGVVSNTKTCILSTIRGGNVTQTYKCIS